MTSRTVESCCALEQKKNDLDGAGYFGKKDPLESEDEDNKVQEPWRQW